MSSLIRRIELRLQSAISDPEAYRQERAKMKASPHWNKPLLKSGRPPRALRRAKKSQAWLAKRAADREARA